MVFVMNAIIKVVVILDIIGGAKMKVKQLNLVYAMKGDKLVHISKVESGLKCNCTCPSCNASLVARKGGKVMHHFAHHNAELCSHGYETSLHLAAKEIITNAKKMWIPAVYLHFDSGRKTELIKSASEIEVEGVSLEKRLDNIIPDIVVTAGGKKLIIEIYVTHAIDKLKLQKIKELDISTIEIDLSHWAGPITEKDLQQVVLGDSLEKQWKYSVLEKIWRKRFVSITEKRTIIPRGYTSHIDQCPIAIRSWRGKPYANFFDDCTGCDFFISEGNWKVDNDNGQKEGYILCSGKARIAHLEDFSLSEKERYKKYDSAREQEKLVAIMSGCCPNCGGKLKERNGKSGVFWGCENYPYCLFTSNIDSKMGEITKAYP